jgi:hypothetical protein
MCTVDRRQEAGDRRCSNSTPGAAATPKHEFESMFLPRVF